MRNKQNAKRDTQNVIRLPCRQAGKTKDIKSPTFSVLLASIRRSGLASLKLRRSGRLTFNGFTLIELLVVITILGVLSSIGLGNFMNSQMKGRDTQRKSDLKQIQNGLEVFNNDKGKYPGSSSPAGGSIEACPFAQGSASPCAWGKDSMTDKDGSGNIRTTYLQRVPEDPKNNFEYCYKTSSDGAKYQLFAKLENTNDPNIITGVTPTCGGNTYNFGAASSNTNLGETL